MEKDVLGNFFVLAPIGALLALGWAFYLGFIFLRKQEPGTEKMQEISSAIRVGAIAYLKRQYKTVGMFFAAMFVILLILAYFNYLPLVVPFAFLSGGFFSGLAGFIGMMTATKANVRTAYAASKSLNKGLRVAFNSGAVMGLTVVGLGLLDLSLWFYGLKWYYILQGFSTEQWLPIVTQAMLNFGMGASSMALFARVGGGIFTKAADVGADLVGKVEAGIPEDDPRNPAVIADNVGDNVGDVAGMGADLYESYVGSIVATSALGVAAGYGLAGVLVPLIMAAIGVIASIIGTFFVRSGEEAKQSVLLKALRRGVFTSAIIIAIFSYFIVRFVLGNVGVYWAILSGLLAGIIIGLLTEYYTSATYKPTQKVADTSVTGPATVIIGGLSVGMLSTALPVIVVGISVVLSFLLSGGSLNIETLKFTSPDFIKGLYGIAISAVGMLSTLGITLATDAYGPIADNAGGIAEMSGLGKEVRERTDALDSLGNTTAATGKGFAIGSAALTALALIAAFNEKIKLSFEQLSIMNPKVLVGVFIGGMLPFLFCSMTMQAVGRAAQKIVEEVRRQFKEIKGLMEGKAKPDYASCVDISTRAAQKEMIAPALLAIASPVIIGMLLGAEAVAGLLAGATVTGFVVAIMMANAGGSWDNAKKYIEAGAHGGKGSLAHKAAVVGDTVGDPFKDTSGPSLNILIKLISMVAIVFAVFIAQNNIFNWFF